MTRRIRPGRRPYDIRKREKLRAYLDGHEHLVPVYHELARRAWR